MVVRTPDGDRRRVEAAEADLAALARPEGVFSSAAARAGRHMSAADADPSDGVELWGRRVGRALSLGGVVALTLLLGRQLGWW